MSLYYHDINFMSIVFCVFCGIIFMSYGEEETAMANNISLTVRLPHTLNTQLQAAAKALGMTKTNLLRSAIHDFLSVENVVLDFSATSDTKDRLVLNINQMTHTILENACRKHSQSMNAIITAVGFLALERSTTWLQSIRP